MADIYRVTDHVDQGIARFISQFQGKPRLAGFAIALVKQVQQLEDAAYDVLIQRMLDNAEGEQLDVLGRIVGELRQGNSDSVYLQYIKARIRINRSRGSTPDMLEVLNMITATSVIFNEYQPACFALELLTIPDRDPVQLYQLLHDTKAGGVKLTMVSPTTNTVAARPSNFGDTNVHNYSVGDARNTAPDMVSTNMGPFNLPINSTLTLLIDGVESWTVTFKASMFANIAAATAAEVAAAINGVARRRHHNAYEHSNRVHLTTWRVGSAASVQVTGGTARTIIGFGTSALAGVGTTNFGLLSDAVTVRDPAAEPPPPPPGPPIVFTVTPPTGLP